MEHKRFLHYLLLTLIVSMFGFGKASATAYAEFRGSTLYFFNDNKHGTRTGVTYDLNVGTNYPGWYSDGTNAKVEQVFFTSSFFSARPTSTYHWFDGMVNLKDISAIEKFDSMPKLSTFKGMKEYLNTSEVRSMRGMFNYLLYVEKLDLSGFDTHNVQDMTAMFGNNFYLETIWVGDGWNTDNDTESKDMFSSCRRLVGGAGTKWDEGHTDVRYAHVDGGWTNPGYFTKALNGDVNNDGAVDVADIAAIIDVMAGNGQEFKAHDDVNGDNTVDVADIGAMAGK